MAQAVAQDSAAAPYLAGLSPEDVRSVVHDFAKFRHINRKVKKDDREKLLDVLMAYVADGQLGEQTSEDGSCMVHVDFKRRFGTGRASCLK